MSAAYIARFGHVCDQISDHSFGQCHSFGNTFQQRIQNNEYNEKSERNPSHATRGLARQKTAFCKQNSYFLPTETNEIAGAASSAKQDRTGYHRREAKPSRQRSEITVLLRESAAGKVGSETRALARPSPPEKHALFTAR